MSILQVKPGVGDDTGFLTFLLGLLIITSSLIAVNAHGFTLFQFGGNRPVNVSRADILHGGSNLSNGAEQTYAQGTFSRSLSDLSQPLNIGLTGSSPGSMSSRVNRRAFMAVSLSGAERAQCLQASDFDVSFRVVGPVADTLSATSGGELRVTSFSSVLTRSFGGACPRALLYGYDLDLDVEGAVSAAGYQGTVEVAVELIGPGTTQTLSRSLTVNMPSVLVLYHPTQVNIDVLPAAIAGALGANSVCGSGYCMDGGNLSTTVVSLSPLVPVSFDIGASVPPVAIRTITLDDAVGVRATGCSGGVYDTASYQILNPSGGIQPGNGVIAGIQSSPCGLDLRTGDLAFDLDLNSIDAVSNASATIQITVVGL